MLHVGKDKSPNLPIQADFLHNLLCQLDRMLSANPFDSFNAILSVIGVEIESFGRMWKIQDAKESPDGNGNRNNTVHHE